MLFHLHRTTWRLRINFSTGIVDLSPLLRIFIHQRWLMVKDYSPSLLRSPVRKVSNPKIHSALRFIFQTHFSERVSLDFSFTCAGTLRNCETHCVCSNVGVERVTCHEQSSVATSLAHYCYSKTMEIYYLILSANCQWLVL